jgi:hypothetical protein
MSLYVYKDGQQLGPYDDEAILQSLRNGAFTSADLASRDGQGDWRPLSFYFPLPDHQAQPEAKTEVFQTGQTQQRDTDPFQYYQPPPAPMASYQPPTMPATVLGDANNNQHETMAMASFGLSIAALCLMLVGLIPCLGWLNYFNFPLSIGAIITGAIVMSQSLNEKHRSKAQMGLIIAGIALIIGAGRLLLGGCVL